ncbi:MAG: hypothetical protein IJU95_02590 [Treponema sp.]|nr:hypothetical protein [Treponema sp.]
MKNLLSSKKKMIFVLLVAFVSAMAFCEYSVSVKCHATVSNAVIINNSRQTVRCGSVSISPGSTATVHTGSNIVIRSNGQVQVSAKTNNRTCTVTVTGGAVSSNNSVNSGTSNSSKKVQVHCMPCHGSGKCPKCNGRKTVASGRNQIKCNRCNGSGVCPYCRGTGRK